MKKNCKIKILIRGYLSYNRGVVLPHGTGKTVRVLALVTPDKEEEARAAGADHAVLI